MRIKDRLKASELMPLLLDLDRDKVYDVDIHEPREKRSLNANAYCWVLCTKLANKLRLSKDEVYQMMLERYGQSTIISVLSNINVNGFFKYYREFGKGHVQGKEFTHYKVLKGSSEYNTEEMSILIDGIVSECQDLGIETMTPAELERLKSLWQSEIKA